MSDKDIADLWFKGFTTPDIAVALVLTECEVMQAIVRTVNATRKEEKWQQLEQTLTG